MKNGCIVLVVASAVFALLIGFAAAAPSVSVSSSGSDKSIVSISGADNIYGYEISFDYSGSYSIQQANFLGSGSDATYGSNAKSGILYVYGSKLDNSAAGVSGSGQLFNITYTGTVSLRNALSVQNEGTETNTDYRTSTPTTTTTAGSSGGGGGGIETKTKTVSLPNIKIEVVPDSIVIDTVSGKESTREIIIKNNGNETIDFDVSVEGLSTIVKAPSKISVAAGGESALSLEIRGVERGLLAGKILLSAGETLAKEIPIMINVRSANFLFDSAIVIPDEMKIVKPGEKIRAQVSLQEVISGQKLDVVANYVIRDFSGRVYLEESETFYVENSKSFVKEFSTAGLPEGKYILGLEIVYPGAFATSSAQFEIAERGISAGNLKVVYAVFAVIAVILLCVILWDIHRRRKIYASHAKKARKV